MIYQLKKVWDKALCLTISTNKYLTTPSSKKTLIMSISRLNLFLIFHRKMKMTMMGNKELLTWTSYLLFRNRMSLVLTKPRKIVKALQRQTTLLIRGSKMEPGHSENRPKVRLPINPPFFVTKIIHQERFIKTTKKWWVK